MDKILQYAIENNASDIHITENKEAWIRSKGKLSKYGEKISISEIDRFINTFVQSAFVIYNAYKNVEIKNKDDVIPLPIDAAFSFMTRRFRLNIYKSYNGINMALRLLSDKILSLPDLHLPDAVEQFTKIQSGMYLVVGTTGSGKSTTLASIIDAINHSRAENILTIEQPIEYIHHSDKSRIEQIEVGKDVPTFEAATVAAMRQDPNIALVGEMRDLATIHNAITLAETGHVVYATLHAKSVTETIDRMIDVFPPNQQEQIRIQVASVLKGVVHQTLVKGTDGKLVPLIEQLVVDDVISAMILGKQKSNTIRDHLRGKSMLGNVHIADNAAWHIQNGRMTVENVKRYMSPDDYNIVKSLTEITRQRRGFDA